MKAMLLHQTASLKDNPSPLTCAEIPEPIPGAGKIGFRTIGADVRVQVRAVRVTALE